MSGHARRGIDWSKVIPDVGYGMGGSAWQDWAPQAFRWRLGGPFLPPIETALLVARAARACVIREAGGIPLPDSFHHAVDGEDSALWLADDGDGDGFIDHVMCVRVGGIQEAVLPLLAAGGEVALPRDAGLAASQRGPWRLSPVWMGRIGPGGLFGPARCWASQTPYLPPRSAAREGGRGRGQAGRTRPGREPEAQLVRDIQEAGLPAPIDVRLSPVAMRGGRLVQATDVLIPPPTDGRSGIKLPPPDCAPGFAVLEFPEPVFGPIALGFGAHSGLGLFEPQPDG